MGHVEGGMIAASTRRQIVFDDQGLAWSPNGSTAGTSARFLEHWLVGWLAGSEDHDWQRARGALRVFGVTGIELEQAGPQSFAFVADCFVRCHVDDASASLNDRFGLCAQVVDPCRVFWLTCVGTADDEAVAVVEAHEGDSARLTGGRLETTTGLTLLERHHAGVTLTPDGVVILTAAHDVLAAHRRLDAIVADRSEHRSEALGLGLVDNVPADLLVSVLGELRALSPELRIDTVVQSTPDNLTAVRTAVLDAAIVRGPLTIDAALHATQLAEQRIGVLLPEASRLADHEQITVAKLAAERLIYFPRTWAPLAFDTHRDQLAIHGIDLDNALVSHNVAQTAGFVTAGLWA